MCLKCTMFTCLLVTVFYVHFVNAAASKSHESSVNTFENVYSKILKEDNLKNETQSFQNEVEHFIRNITRKILPIIINILSQISITENCKSSLVNYVDGLVNMKGWALEMFDSTSKPPSGLLEGTLSELGSFDQCLNIEIFRFNGSTDFTGQYCAVEIKKIFISKKFHTEKDQRNQSTDFIETDLKDLGSQFNNSNFQLGVCVPSKCTQQDMSKISEKVGKNFQMDIRIPKCYVKEPTVLKPVHIATICAVSFLLLMSIYGSILEHSLKEMPVIGRSRYQDVIVCFSLISNYRRFLSAPKKCDKFKMLTGMRALTIAWVMVGHNYAWTNFLLTSRPKQLSDGFHKLQFGLMLNSWISVEAFFIINGLLTSYSVLKHLHATQGRINVPIFIIRRYLRHLLLLLLIMGFAFFMPIVSSGPFWYAEVDAELNNCVQRWWAGLLFISNWFSMKKICISPASWFISADLQLHAASLIVLYPLYRSPKFGLSLVVLFIVACCMGVGAVTYINDLPPIIQATSSNKQKVQDIIDLVHLRPFTHGGPYFVGVIVGYAFFKDNAIKINKMPNVLGWLTSTVLALTALYGANNWNPDQHDGPLLASLFAAAHRTTFALAVAWVIFVCITGNAGWVESFLSCSVLSVVGKLTFMVFLLHSLVFWTRKGSVRERMFLSNYNMLYEYIGNVFITLLLALPCHLLLEAPITRLDALLFPEKTEEKPSLRVTNDPEVESNTNSTIPSKEDNYTENMQNIYISYPSRNVIRDKAFKTVVSLTSNETA